MIEVTTSTKLTFFSLKVFSIQYFVRLYGMYIAMQWYTVPYIIHEAYTHAAIHHHHVMHHCEGIAALAVVHCHQ